MNLFAFSGVTNAAADVTFAVVFAVFTVLTVAAAVWLIIRFIGREETRSPAALAGMIIGLGVIVRLILCFTVRGYRGDTAEMLDVMDGGLAGYYDGGGSLFPLTALVYRLMGLMTGGFDFADNSIWPQFFVKLPLIAADAFTAMILYLLAKKYVNGYVGTVLAGLYSLCPACMFASSVWGAAYPVMIVGMVLSMYFLVGRNYLGLTVTFALTLLTGREALFLIPVVAVYVVYAFVKACIAVRRSQGGEGILASPETAPVVKLPLYVVGSVLVAYLVSLPAVLPDYGAGFFGWIYRFFLLPLVELTYFGYNSIGIFNLFGKNGDLLGSGFPATVFAVVFAILTVGIVLLVYLSKKNRANLVFTAAYVLMTLATYFVDFGAMALAPVLALLIFSFAVTRDKRVFRILLLTAFAFTVNASAVMISAGYLSNATDSVLSTGNAAYTGQTLLSGGVNTAISVICSVIAVLTHIYFTLVVLDISVSDHRRLLDGDTAAGFRQAIRQFYR